MEIITFIRLYKNNNLLHSASLTDKGIAWCITGIMILQIIMSFFLFLVTYRIINVSDDGCNYMNRIRETTRCWIINEYRMTSKQRNEINHRFRSSLIWPAFDGALQRVPPVNTAANRLLFADRWRNYVDGLWNANAKIHYDVPLRSIKLNEVALSIYFLLIIVAATGISLQIKITIRDNYSHDWKILVSHISVANVVLSVVSIMVTALCQYIVCKVDINEMWCNMSNINMNLDFWPTNGNALRSSNTMEEIVDFSLFSLATEKAAYDTYVGYDELSPYALTKKERINTKRDLAIQKLELSGRPLCDLYYAHIEGVTMENHLKYLIFLMLYMIGQGVVAMDAQRQELVQQCRVASKIAYMELLGGMAEQFNFFARPVILNGEIINIPSPSLNLTTPQKWNMIREIRILYNVASLLDINIKNNETNTSNLQIAGIIASVIALLLIILIPSDISSTAGAIDTTLGIALALHVGTFVTVLTALLTTTYNTAYIVKLWNSVKYLNETIYSWRHNRWEGTAFTVEYNMNIRHTPLSHIKRMLFAEENNTQTGWEEPPYPEMFMQNNAEDAEMTIFDAAERTLLFGR